MSYYVVYLPMKDEELSQTYRPDHLAFVDEQIEKGNVKAKGKFADGSGGMVIYQAESLEAAEKIAKQDPYVEKGARGMEIKEWIATFA
ncbi:MULTISPECIES: YciI family protein [Bhargavaea]|uniref:YciI family protein n=1 Tax=Bhargavaea changchunensis TaxID=2134037 RepID=A0ABW2NEL8_9BACL|nr:YciI family protein [Bhargavaea sp. CC-171006]